MTWDLLTLLTPYSCRVKELRAICLRSCSGVTLQSLISKCCFQRLVGNPELILKVQSEPEVPSAGLNWAKLGKLEK